MSDKLIYAIGLRGLVEARFSIEENPRAKVRTVRKENNVWVTDAEGQLVWQTYESAQDAARMLNVKELTKRKVSTLEEKSNWIILGINADWKMDTLPQSNTAFPTAHQLNNPARFQELPEHLMFGATMEITEETKAE